jgi:hypothetical protein
LLTKRLVWHAAARGRLSKGRKEGTCSDVQCSRRLCFVLFLHVLDDRQAGGRSRWRFLLQRRLHTTGHWCAGACPWYTSSSTPVRVSTDVPWSVTATACSGSLCIAHCVKAASSWSSRWTAFIHWSEVFLALSKLMARVLFRTALMGS